MQIPHFLLLARVTATLGCGTLTPQILKKTPPDYRRNFKITGGFLRFFSVDSSELAGVGGVRESSIAITDRVPVCEEDAEEHRKSKCSGVVQVGSGGGTSIFDPWEEAHREITIR